MRFVLLGLALSLLPALAASAEDGQVLARTTELDGRTYGWQVFVPAAVLSGAETNPPVILFLHGGGQVGSDGVRQTEIGLPAVLRERSDFPALVVMPQSPRGAWWGTPEIERMALAALDAAVAEFGGDPERTYLTGLSLGGYGTWALAFRYPERFAALVPVCGGITTSRTRMPVPDWHPSATHPEDPWAETARVRSRHSGVGLPRRRGSAGTHRRVPAHGRRARSCGSATSLHRVSRRRAQLLDPGLSRGGSLRLAPQPAPERERSLAVGGGGLAAAVRGAERRAGGVRGGVSPPLGLAACGETQAAFGRRSIPAEPLRFAPFCVAFRSKYTRYSSLTRLVSRAPHQPRRSPGFHHRLLNGT